MGADSKDCCCCWSWVAAAALLLGVALYAFRKYQKSKVDLSE
jgi:hypothetical protein